MPVACNAIDIIAPDTRIILLTSGGLTVLPAAIFTLCSSWLANEITLMSNNLKRMARCLLSVIAVLIIANYAMIVNTDGIVMKQEQEKTIALANRICTRIEQENSEAQLWWLDRRQGGVIR